MRNYQRGNIKISLGMTELHSKLWLCYFLGDPVSTVHFGSHKPSTSFINVNSLAVDFLTLKSQPRTVARDAHINICKSQESID